MESVLYIWSMKEELKLKIDGAKTLEELHAVWELIKTAKLSEDKFLMAKTLQKLDGLTKK